MACKTFSASLGWSQKVGVNVIASSSVKANNLASTSKMPPQRRYPVSQILQIFFSHAANINFKNKYFEKQQRTALTTDSLTIHL
jgi:hypothetical protein